MSGGCGPALPRARPSFTWGCCHRAVAEGEGFEPPIPVRGYRFSKPALSASLPTLRAAHRKRERAPCAAGLATAPG